MQNNLLAQLALWHEENEHQRIVDTIMEIPAGERDHQLIGQLARALNNLKRYAEALEQLQSIAEQEKNDHLWHFRVGYSHYYLEQYEDAVSAFEAANSLNPEDSSTLMFLEWSRSALLSESSDLSNFWDDSDYALKEYVSEPPTDELIASVEEELGYKLPAAYIEMMKQHNGGIPRNACFPTEVTESWGAEYISIAGILGIGREKSYSLGGEFGSRFMIEDWGYPDIGVVFCDCPSAGHDVVMLDYRKCGRDGEPEVIHVDQEGDYAITYLAPSFEAFIRGLVNYDVYDTSEADKEEALRRVSSGQFSALLTELCGNVVETADIEGQIRAVCTKIVEEKGHFSFHNDELSTLMYDVQFWLYTKTYPNTSREEYLLAYDKMIAFGGEFGQNGYAPGWITEWLDQRMQQGMITERSGALSFTEQAVKDVLSRLKSAAVQSEAVVLPAEAVAPFILVEQGNGGMSVILSVGRYKAELFETRRDEGFEGNGYDWTSLAAVFLEEKMPELADTIRFDPEADMFCAYSSNRAAVQSFATGFKAACEDDERIRDLFSRAELD
ncbi:Imm51 family immunity protein [Paenibacillus sp. GCM10012306]|uniref:Imm51 family immunity protein n=1 Tax=Paenibacillus sp. GCM10012306 TaxID=3317342 RepID=UPI003610982F